MPVSKEALTQYDAATDRCHSKAYSMFASTSGQAMSNQSTTLQYGSANLQGFLWKDYACLQPMSLNGVEASLVNASYLAAVTDKSSYNYTKEKEKRFLEKQYVFQNENKCSFFQFVTLYKDSGLGAEADGILGLAPQKSVTNNGDKNYLWSLYNNGIIARPVMSFSISSSDINDDSYALFGGYNSSQILSGEQGIQTFRNSPGDYKQAFKSWALPTGDFYYGNRSLSFSGQTRTYPAIIDTGSSFIAVPPEEYLNLREKWRDAVPSLNCDVDPTFCQSRKSCKALAKKLEPVQFRIENTLFELKPMAYLHQGQGICQFAIAKNPLDNFNNGQFLFGSLFLKHFYTIYDFDQEYISLGVNVHSQHLVSMKQFGGFPNELKFSSKNPEKTVFQNASLQENEKKATPAQNQTTVEVASANKTNATSSLSATEQKSPSASNSTNQTSLVSAAGSNQTANAS